MREVHENAVPLEGEPGLVDPALCACYLSALLELCDLSRPPGFLPARIRKIPFRKIKMNLHETS
jgi:hypothetical protein